MSWWAFWRKKPEASHKTLSPIAVDPDGLAGVLQLALAWLLPSSAAVVGALGQFALALVLLTLAFGVWLRVWRSGKRRRAAQRNRH